MDVSTHPDCGSLSHVDQPLSDFTITQSLQLLNLKLTKQVDKNVVNKSVTIAFSLEFCKEL